MEITLESCKKYFKLLKDIEHVFDIYFGRKDFGRKGSYYHFLEDDKALILHSLLKKEGTEVYGPTIPMVPSNTLLRLNWEGELKITSNDKHTRSDTKSLDDMLSEIKFSF